MLDIRGGAPGMHVGTDSSPKPHRGQLLYTGRSRGASRGHSPPPDHLMCLKSRHIAAEVLGHGAGDMVQGL